MFPPAVEDGFSPSGVYVVRRHVAKRLVIPPRNGSGLRIGVVPCDEPGSLRAGGVEHAVPTTGRAVSSGSSGIGISAVSRCGKCNYGKINDLRKTPPKNFKTGSFDRSDTSPLSE